MRFETYYEAVCEMLQNEYLLMDTDITDEEQIRQAYENGESYKEFVEWLAEKYDLIQIV